MDTEKFKNYFRRVLTSVFPLFDQSKTSWHGRCVCQRSHVIEEWSCDYLLADWLRSLESQHKDIRKFEEISSQETSEQCSSQHFVCLNTLVLHSRNIWTIPWTFTPRKCLPCYQRHLWWHERKRERGWHTWKNLKSIHSLYSKYLSLGGKIRRWQPVSVQPPERREMILASVYRSESEANLLISHSAYFPKTRKTTDCLALYFR